jgi:hypothetical protein
VVSLSADGNTLAVSAYYESSSAKGVNGESEQRQHPAVGRRLRVHARRRPVVAAGVRQGVQPGRGRRGRQLRRWRPVRLLADAQRRRQHARRGATAEDSGFADNQADNSKMSAGAVYVFARTGTAWAQQAYLKPSNIDAGDQFGYAVSLSADGNVLAAGSYDEGGSSRVVDGPQDNMRNGSGAVYIFARTGTTWRQTNYLKAANAEAGDSFGDSISLSDDGNTIAIGALDEDCVSSGVNPAPCDNDRAADMSTGAAYIFVRTGNTWVQQAFFKQSNAKDRGDWFGCAARAERRRQHDGVGRHARGRRIEGDQRESAGSVGRRFGRGGTSSRAPVQPGDSWPTSRRRTRMPATSSAVRWRSAATAARW